MRDELAAMLAMAEAKLIDKYSRISSALVHRRLAHECVCLVELRPRVPPQTERCPDHEQPA